MDGGPAQQQRPKQAQQSVSFVQVLHQIACSVDSVVVLLWRSYPDMQSTTQFASAFSTDSFNVPS